MLGSRARVLAAAGLSAWGANGSAVPVFYLHADAPLRDLAQRENIPMPALLLLPLLIAGLWVTGSYVFSRRWQRRGDLPVGGWPIVWRYVLPLTLDVCLTGSTRLPAQVT